MGDLILMDAGCEVFGYVSDVTRTWPATGHFSGAQKDLYEGVLSVHKRVLEECRIGTSIKELHGLSIMLLSEVLSHLGICSASTQSLVGGLYRQFYPHMIGEKSYGTMFVVRSTFLKSITPECTTYCLELMTIMQL